MAANLEMMESASSVVSIPPEFLPEWVKQRVEVAGVVVSEMLPETINLVNLGQEKLPRRESFSLTEMLISSGSRYAYVRSDMVSPRADAISVAEGLPSFLPSKLVNFRIEELPLERGDLLPCPTATC